jgi:hypothetical protein
MDALTLENGFEVIVTYTLSEKDRIDDKEELLTQWFNKNNLHHAGDQSTYLGGNKPWQALKKSLESCCEKLKLSSESCIYFYYSEVISPYRQTKIYRIKIS